MKWLEIIARHRDEVLEKLFSPDSAISDDGILSLENRINEVHEHCGPLPVIPFLAERSSLFPDDSIFGAAALLHFVNAAEAGHMGNLDWLTHSLTAGTWAAAIFLGTESMKAAINKFEPMATEYEKIIDQKRRGGKNSHELKEPERIDRNTRIREEATRLRANGKTGRSAAKILAPRFDLHERTIRKIIDQEENGA